MPKSGIMNLCFKVKHESNHANNIGVYDANNGVIFSRNEIPSTINELLVYLAREGVAVVDIFRRPGNTQEITQVMEKLKSNSSINWQNYNFYTLANIAKRFLLQIDSGIFGEEVEKELLQTLEMPDDQTRIEAMSRILKNLPIQVQKLLAMFFGIWFRMIYHSEVNSMSVEAVAKSVTGSVFKSINHNPAEVNKASKVMEYLITGFASAELFGRDLIDYFTTQTQTGISRIEKFRYELIYPCDIPKRKIARLFVKMLLDESAKHNFDLFKHAVTEDQFNAVHENNAVQIDTNSDPQQQQQHSYHNNNSSSTTTSNHLVVNNNGSAVDTNNLPPTSLANLPGRKRRSSKPLDSPTTQHKSSQDNNFKFWKDQQLVQQTSEKRTCFTAPAITSEEELDAINSLVLHSTPSPSPSATAVLFNGAPDAVVDGDAKMPLSKTEDNKPLNEFVDSELRILQSETASSSHGDACRTQVPSQVPLLANEERFTQVKQKQAARMQVRSQWFRSAPTGLQRRHDNNITNPQLNNQLGGVTGPQLISIFPTQLPTTLAQPATTQIDLRYFMVRRVYPSCDPSTAVTTEE